MPSIIDTVKTINELAKKGMTIELQETIMQLREQALELQEENYRLKKENGELKAIIELKEKIQFRRKVYWRKDDDTPFCPYCLEKSNVRIHLSGPEKMTEDGRITGYLYTCQECGIKYFTKEKEDFKIWIGRSRK